MKPSFTRRLTVSYLFVVAVTLLLTGLYLTRSLRHEFLRQLEQSMAAQATLLGQTFRTALSAPETPALQERVHELGQTLGDRVTVIRKDGVVMADSERTAGEVRQMDNHLERPEVQAALRMGSGEARRYSATLLRPMLYIAVPIRGENSQTLGILRVALSTTEVDQRVASFQNDLLKAGGVALVIALLVALFSVRRISEPLHALVESAQAIGAGHYSTQPTIRSSDEFGRLAAAFAEMARRINEKVGELSHERAQLSTILSALVESVIALDAHGRILFLNPAAERLFGVRSDEVNGRPLLEALRHSALNETMTTTLAQGRPIASEMTVHSPEERMLSVQSLPVNYGQGETGVLAALHDITELRRLERMRQEFVANASHELKTPLTSIKGFVETLLDGAIDDPKHNRSFLETIQEQSNRLMRLIEDLLDLSAIEARRIEFRFEPVALAEVAERVRKGLEPMARAQDVSLDFQLAPELPKVRADREKLAQILLNLVDNAVKFNRKGGKVIVRAETSDRAVTVTVQDTGMGIPSADLPRVFERFFRSDRSHSHEIAGTGLGLAIVKHLVESHQGAVSVDSVEGQGATFRFSLPRA